MFPITPNHKISDLPFDYPDLVLEQKLTTWIEGADVKLGSLVQRLSIEWNEFLKVIESLCLLSKDVYRSTSTDEGEWDYIICLETSSELLPFAKHLDVDSMNELLLTDHRDLRILITSHDPSRVYTAALYFRELGFKSSYAYKESVSA